MGVSSNSPLPAKALPDDAADEKARALRATSDVPSPAASGSDLEDDGERDVAEELNASIRAKYRRGKKLGEGTYASVFLGHQVNDPTKMVALKKFKKLDNFKDGISMDALREIKFLRELSHPNIIELKDVFSSKDQNINMVIEYLPRGDLKTIYYRGDQAKGPRIDYTAADIKAWMGMILRAVWFCHENFIIHRDIKGDNLLIAADGSLKLADFGLARSFADPGTKMTHQVVTSFYRPPELFLGATYYSAAVDIWSVGIVMGELCKYDYWVPGHTDLEIFNKMIDVWGTPTEQNWPGVHQLPQADLLPKSEKDIKAGWPAGMWSREFGVLGPVGIQFLRSMTTLDPRKRLTAKQLLQHDYFKVAPAPTKTANLPKAGGGPIEMAEVIKRKPGEALEPGRADKVARKIDFKAMQQ